MSNQSPVSDLFNYVLMAQMGMSYLIQLKTSDRVTKQIHGRGAEQSRAEEYGSMHFT